MALFPYTLLLDLPTRSTRDEEPRGTRLEVIFSSTERATSEEAVASGSESRGTPSEAQGSIGGSCLKERSYRRPGWGRQVEDCVPREPVEPMAETNVFAGGPALRVKLPQFRGRRHDNPDNHVNEFEIVCAANGYLRDMDKVCYFPCTLKDIAMEWYVQYECGHFTTWVALKDAFLECFRLEKTPVQLLQKLYTIKQGSKEYVVEYVGCLRTLYNRLDAQSQPTTQVLVGWFIVGLWKEFRGILASATNVANLDQAQEIATRVESNTKRLKAKKKGKE